MSITFEDLRKLLALIEATVEEEIDCEELLGRLAGYVERLGPDGSPPPGYDDVVQHLQVCPECCEEVEALLRVVRATCPSAAASTASRSRRKRWPWRQRGTPGGRRCDR
jgi:hypothetical protein